MAANSLLTEHSARNNLPELEALGCSLREARKARGLSLEALASRLNMGLEQLKALEGGNRERLREPVFVIAQARRVASALGVTVDEQIEALRRNPCFTAKPSTPGPIQQSKPQRPTCTSRPAARSTAALPLNQLLMAFAVVAGVMSATVGLQRHQLQLAVPKPPPIAPRSPAIPGGSDATPPQATSNAAGTLRISARGPSWLEVTSNQGQILFRDNFKGVRTFPLGNGLRVLAGRPDLVMTQVGDAPAKVLGPISQVEWRHFDQAPKAPAP